MDTRMSDFSRPQLRIPDTEEECAEYAKEILRHGWSDHMWEFDNLGDDEIDWLRAWVGLSGWADVNLRGRCEHGFAVGACPNVGCGG